MNAAQQHGLAAGDERMFRDLFERCARRFHDFNVTQGAVLHRNWKFENCPAEACASARKALGLRVNPLGCGCVTKTRRGILLHLQLKHRIVLQDKLPLKPEPAEVPA